MRSYEKKCGRCGGTGIYSQTHGGCFNCGGNRATPGSGRVTVIVYTKEEKASQKLTWDRTLTARRLIEDCAKARHHEDRFYAHHGVSELMTREPERFARLLDSIDAGRVADVTEALISYCRDGYPIWYGEKNVGE